MELHRELSYGQPNGSPMRAILALYFFLSVGLYYRVSSFKISQITKKVDYSTLQKVEWIRRVPLHGVASISDFGIEHKNPDPYSI